MPRPSLAALVLAAAGGAALPPPAPAAEAGVIETDRDRLVVPFDFDAESLRRAGAVAVDLLVSVDGGPFARAASVAPGEERFVYDAPAAGTYAFCVRARDAAGTPMPAGAPRAGMIVRVRPKAPAASANASMVLASPASSGRSVELLPPPAEQRSAEAPPTFDVPDLPTRTAAAAPPVIRPNAPTPVAASPAPGLVAAAPAVASTARPTPRVAEPAPYGGGQTPVYEDTLSERQVVPSRKFELGFEVDDVGPSGVERVTLYITEDAGRNWFLYGTDADRRSPFPVELQGDGEYGFAFRVTSGVGLVSPPPQPGEPAEIELAVDTAPPVVRLTAPTLERLGGRQEVTVRWEIDESNPTPRSVSIDVAGSAAGPWTEIASGLSDSGRHVWPVPGDAAPAAYFRVRAADAAGHAGTATTAKPLILDASRPTARVTLIRPIAD